MDSYTQFVLKSCYKTPRTQSEAFRDAEYATALEMPQKGEYDHIWAILGVLSALCVIVWVASRF